MRLDLPRGGLAQRANLARVAELVRELDDARYAAEVLEQADRAAERLAREIVDGRLAVVELLVRDVDEHLVDQRLDRLGLGADGVRADLLVIADNRDLLAHREGDEAEHVALARLVDDHDVECGGRDVEALDDARQRHDPDGHRVAALAERLARFFLESPDLLAGALAHLLLQCEPAPQRLLLLEAGAPELRTPRERLDVLRGGLLQLLTRARELRHHVLEIDAVDPRERLRAEAVRERLVDLA